MREIVIGGRSGDSVEHASLLTTCIRVSLFENL